MDLQENTNPTDPQANALMIDLVARLVREIAPDADLDVVDPDQSLFDEVGLDSLDFLRLMTRVHEETGVDIPALEFPQVLTISGLAQRLRRR